MGSVVTSTAGSITHEGLLVSSHWIPPRDFQQIGAYTRPSPLRLGDGDLKAMMYFPRCTLVARDWDTDLARLQKARVRLLLIVTVNVKGFSSTLDTLISVGILPHDAQVP